MAEATPQVAVGEKLTAVALERVRREAETLGGEAGRLELLDQPGTFRPLDAAIQSSREHRGPLFDSDPCLEMNFAAVRPVRFAPGGKDARVELGPDAETTPAVSSVETDATEAFVFRKLSDGELEGPGRLVEPQGRETSVDCRRKNRIDPL